MLLLVLAIASGAFAQAQSVQGRWKSSCPEAGYPSSTEMAFTSSTSEWALRIFSDETCEAASFERLYRFDYSVPGRHPANPSMFALDLRVSAVIIRPLSDEIAEEYNRTAYCGLQSWQKNLGFFVTGLNCGGEAIFARGTLIFASYQFDGSQKLSLGRFTELEDGSSQTLRPSQPDLSIVYNRQRD